MGIIILVCPAGKWDMVKGWETQYVMVFRILQTAYCPFEHHWADSRGKRKHAEGTTWRTTESYRLAAELGSWPRSQFAGCSGKPTVRFQLQNKPCWVGQQLRGQDIHISKAAWNCSTFVLDGTEQYYHTYKGERRNGMVMKDSFQIL